LCAGYGGIELGLSRAIPNLRSVALCEIEAFACANLVAKMEAGLMDAAPIWTDLKTFPWSEFRGRVDILSGGYPCQPFSAAGKRLGTEDPRHLWPYIADGIAAMRPSICFFENVEGHISMGLSDVIEDLAGMGYRTTWGIFSAREVGAPHQRKRVFIMAYRNCQRGQLPNWWKLAAESLPVSNGQTRGNAWPSRPGQPQYGWEPPRVVANTQSSMSWVKAEREWRKNTGGRSEEIVGNAESRTRFWRSPWDSRHLAQPDQDMGNANSSRPQERSRQGGSGLQGANSDGGENSDWQAQPALGRDIDGSSCGMDAPELYVTCDNRTDELRLLGNGVVPATAERAFRTLLTELLND